MTPTELINLITLRIEMGVGIPVPPATYANYIEWEDISDYASHLNPGETVKTVMKVLSPVGVGVYENAGYATDDFSNPDYPTNNPNEAQLPLAASGNPVQGVYQFLIKAQFDDGVGGDFIVQKTINSLALCLDDEPTPVLSETYSCEEGTFTSTDATEYGNSYLTLLTVERDHTVYPPAVSGQTPTTINGAVNEVGSLWTGTYEASLTATVTYQNGNNYFVFYIETDTEETVTCDSALCVLYCCLLKIRNKYYEFAAAQGLNSTEVQSLYRKLLLGTTEYFMAIRAQLCGQSIDTHVAKFYQVTGCDPTCDCCDEDAPAPVIPAITTLQGADGTDGLTPEFRMNGTIFQWKYTTEVVWTDLIDFSLLSLTPDFQGYNYELYVSSVTPVSTSAVSVLQTLKTNTTNFTTIPLVTIGNGDYVKITAVFQFTTNKATTAKTVYLKFGSTVVAGWYQDSTVGIPNPTIEIELKISRTGAATQLVEVKMQRNGETLVYTTGGTETWAGNITTLAQGYIGDATADVDEITIVDFKIENQKQII